jgi:outer membrane receptor protein involved in Fe transport
VVTGALVGAVGTVKPGTPAYGSETGTTPRFALKYAFSPTSMVYASAAQGFRAGGPGAAPANQQTAACLNALSKAGLEPGGSFQSDKLTSYELGSKTTWRDNGILLDVAAFYVDWSNLQNSFILNNFDVNCPGVTTGNGGKATSKGGEVNAAYRALTNLSLKLAASYTDAKLGQQPLGSPLLEGTRLQNAPIWQATAGAQYDFTLPVTGYAGFLRGDFSYYGWQWSNQSSEPNPFFYVPARAIVNVRLGMAPRDSNWGAEFYVDNVLNREQIYGAQSFFGEPNTNQALVGRPRSAGVLVRYSWR